MTRRTFWGFAALIILLIAAGGFIYWQLLTVQQLKEELAQDNKLLEEENKPVAENNLPTPDPGKKWVPHGDHFHMVDIDAPDTWQGGAHEPMGRDVSNSISAETMVTYPMPDNPVETLREYLEKRGHWSAKWIPEFAPDDEEAARMAYNYWVKLQHEEAGNEYYDGPALIPNKETLEMLEHYKYLETPRAYNMYKLSWSNLDVPVDSPESFNIYGFDKAAFDAKRQARIDAERQAKLEENR